MARDFTKFDTDYDNADYDYLNRRNNDWMYRGPHHGKGPRNYRRSDQSIQEEICDKLTWDGDIDASEIEVQVQDGEVTLTGTIPDRRIKRLVEQDVESVRGVQQIYNQLRVQNASQQYNERW